MKVHELCVKNNIFMESLLSPTRSSFLSKNWALGFIRCPRLFCCRLDVALAFFESAVMCVFILAGMVGMEEGMKDFARC